MTKAIVTDIEGTTSSIDFVKKVLFPFARKRLPAFIETHIDNPDVLRWLEEAAREADLHAVDKGQLIDVLLAWADSDRKSTSLKALQGMIWKEGYESGAYQAHMYPEVAGCLRRWHEDGFALYVYSSGCFSATAKRAISLRYSTATSIPKPVRNAKPNPTAASPKASACSLPRSCFYPTPLRNWTPLPRQAWIPSSCADHNKSVRTMPRMNAYPTLTGST